MGVYKVIQDIEAEDKLVGPLSLKQFLFAIGAVLFFYLSFIAVTKHATFLLVVFLPPALIALFFAWPFSADQPTEIWALAKLRFLFKPRKRTWDQSGIKDLVTITAPKKVAEPMRTDGLSQYEVQSRLNALANTIDSRGWAVKNAAINMAIHPADGNGSDRLINSDGLPQEVPSYDVQAADDILDEQNNPIAQQFDQMITASSQAHRQQLIQMMQQPGMSLPAPVRNNTNQAAQTAMQTASMPTSNDNYWFMNQANNPVAGQPKQARTIPGASSSGAQPISAADNQTTTTGPAPNNSGIATVPLQPTNPDILQLAGNNDLNIDTIARQAHKKDHGELAEHEVVISLH